jgi:hypothetical protein
MINQLIGSSQAEKHSLKASRAKHSTIDTPKGFKNLNRPRQFHTSEIEQPSERSLPRKLTPIKFESYDQEEDSGSMWDIENSVRNRLKQK